MRVFVYCLGLAGVLAGLIALGPRPAAARVAADPEAPSFSKDIKPLLTRYCAECHSGNRTRSGVNVESYTSVTNGRKKLVTPGDAASSTLVRVLKRDGKKLMPPAR